MESRGEVLNQFLVEVFGQILKAEAACLAGKDLSLRELHLIDAVCRAVDQGGDNRSTAIAAALGITAGTLTSAVNLLEKKGTCSAAGMNATSGWYTCCRPSGAGPPTRATGLSPADGGPTVLDGLTDEEAECTLRALGRVAEFFRRGAPERG